MEIEKIEKRKRITNVDNLCESETVNDNKQ